MGDEATTLKGGCLCGAMRYTISGEPLFVSQCACKDCQKATGTGHTTIIGIHKSQLALAGTPTTFTNEGDTGGKVTRHFCGTCAGRLYTSGDLPGDVIMVQAGSLDDPDQVYPDGVIYMKDAPRWDYFDPTLPKYQAMRPRAHHTATVGEARPTDQ
jgi:hypothetical protein